MLNEYLQGENDKGLFEAVGRLALSIDVHKKIGTPISSADGDWWFVSSRPSGASDGFSLLRISKTSGHIRFAYSGNAATRQKLVRMAIAKARELGTEVIYTNERKDDPLYQALGFSMKPNKRQGDFVRWELKL